jgi:Pyridoxamine 5'-phosphate oxidase
MIPDEAKPAMQGILPSTMVTCSLAGIPNVTDISQVWYVDPDHVALSHQFFNKTYRNVRENPYAEVMIRDPQTFQEWRLEIQYDHSEESGPLFDAMDVELEAIASLTGMSGVFKLRAADVYRVLSIRKSLSRT